MDDAALVGMQRMTTLIGDPRVRLVAWILVALVLAACQNNPDGGGGGGGAPAY